MANSRLNQSTSLSMKRTFDNIAHISDVTISLVDSNQTIIMPGHKLILSENSEYFFGLFKNKPQESDITVKVSNATIAEEIIMSMYDEHIKKKINLAEWKYIIENIRIRDFFCMPIDINKLYWIRIPAKYFGDLVDFLQIIRLKNDVMIYNLLRKNIPPNYPGDNLLEITDYWKKSGTLCFLNYRDMDTCNNHAIFLTKINYHTGEQIFVSNALPIKRNEYIISPNNTLICYKDPQSKSVARIASMIDCSVIASIIVCQCCDYWSHFAISNDDKLFCYYHKGYLIIVNIHTNTVVQTSQCPFDVELGITMEPMRIKFNHNDTMLIFTACISDNFLDYRRVYTVDLLSGKPTYTNINLPCNDFIVLDRNRILCIDSDQIIMWNLSSGLLELHYTEKYARNILNSPSLSNKYRSLFKSAMESNNNFVFGFDLDIFCEYPNGQCIAVRDNLGFIHNIYVESGQSKIIYGMPNIYSMIASHNNQFLICTDNHVIEIYNLTNNEKKLCNVPKFRITNPITHHDIHLFSAF